MRTFLTLVRREFWEERGAFLTTPLVVGGVIVFFAILLLVVAAVVVVRVNGEEFVLAKLVEGLTRLSPAELDLAWNVNLYGLAGLFNVVLFFVVFFYLLGSLHEDRKDRSVLFWKSMPVSDLQTVLSKLVAATILAPALMVGALAVTHLLLMVITTFLLLSADLSPWGYLWAPADPLRVWLLLLAAYLVQGLWMLPIWGWLLLASAWARGRPFLWAVVPPILFAVLQTSFNIAQYLRWDDNWMWKLLGERLLGGVVPLSLIVDIGDDDGERVRQILRFEDGQLVESEAPMTFAGLFSRLADGELWWGVLVGSLFVAAAVWVRRFRNET